MEPFKDIRWKQRFENFEKSFFTLEKFVPQKLTTELERAGLIQLFEVTFELSWKTLKDYLESEGFSTKSPRETLKTAFQTGLIEDGHVWIDALGNRNLAAHTYDEALSEKLIEDIREVYFPAIHKLHQRLLIENGK